MSRFREPHLVANASEPDQLSDPQCITRHMNFWDLLRSGSRTGQGNKFLVQVSG
jgi:hypothetical protein